MSSKLRHRSHYHLPEIDMTPLLDALFNLVVFFIMVMSVNSVFGIAIKFSSGGGGGGANQDRDEKKLRPVMVYVYPDNYKKGHQVTFESYIKLNDEVIAMGNENTDSLQFTKRRLQGLNYLEKQISCLQNCKEFKGKYDTNMLVTGEMNTYHGKIVEIIDQGKKAGIKGFSLLPPQAR